MVVRIHWALAAWASAAVLRIEGVPHAMTWCEHGLERIEEFANSWFGSVLRGVRLRKYRKTQHPVVLTRPVREAGRPGYVDHPDPPFLRDVSDHKRAVACRSNVQKISVPSYGER